jgi:hypothetical protein
MKIIKPIYLPKAPESAAVDVIRFANSKRQEAIRKEWRKIPPLSSKFKSNEVVAIQQSKVAARLARHAFKVKPEMGADWATRRPTYPTGFHASLQSLLCSIQCSISNVYRAIALGNVASREASFYELNSQVLDFYRKLSIERVEYADHQNVACTDHFIAPHLRAYGKRKTGAALQRAQAWCNVLRHGINES